MVDIYPAHIVKKDDEYKEQSVSAHCRNTAVYAAEKLKKTGLYHTAYLEGIIHDMGKYTKAFSDYIWRSVKGESVAKGSVIHTFTPVVYLMERYHKNSPPAYPEVTCELIAYAVGSHHGEFDCVTLDGESGFEYRIEKSRDEIRYDEAVENYHKYCVEEKEIDRLFALSVEEVTTLFKSMRDKIDKKKNPTLFLIGMAARMLLSALVDGDRRDTAEIMRGKKIEYVDTENEFWISRLSSFETKLNDFQRSAFKEDSENKINKARGYFSDKCCEFGAKYGSGIYRLNLPTGAGKTLSALRYALSNAAEFEKKRMIFVIPLLSILDQNSKKIRENIDDDKIITEHHSNVVKEFDSPEELDKYELLTETWESPIIITTLVQLLNTLFAGKMSCVRRMSALADSVIVIDEIQSLPQKTMSMFSMAMNYLAYCCGATVVLSSATQPCFDMIKSPIKFSAPCDIVPFEKELFGAFKRTQVVDLTTPYGMTLDELADFTSEKAEQSNSTLIICNTKYTALELFIQMKRLRDDSEVYHLSASMCMKHRCDVLDSINKALSKKRKVIVVATQLVEAGVDFSFRTVIRVVAGMDNVAQAAGRCNRNGDFKEICDVYVVNLKADAENLSMLKEIKTAQRCTSQLFSKYKNDEAHYGYDLLSDESINGYYTLLFEDMDTKKQMDYPEKTPLGSNITLFELLSDNLTSLERPKFKEQYFINQAFKTAGEYFKVFDEQTTDIVVPYNDEAKVIIADLTGAKAEYNYGFFKETLEKAKPYTIRIYEYQRRMLSEDGMLYYDKNGYFTALNELRYSSETGLYNKEFIY